MIPLFSLGLVILSRLIKERSSGQQVKSPLCNRLSLSIVVISLNMNCHGPVLIESKRFKKNLFRVIFGEGFVLLDLPVFKFFTA